ncbi:MAG TPA: hypothetical protein VHV31_01385 [Nitrolancea sp.]|nr:hypothetical protein [Nitrolancea sp.]
MAKKTTRVGRDGRPKLNESQLQAYRARQAATVAVTRPVNTEAAPERASERASRTKRAEQTGHVTAWGHVDDEYLMIRSDLIRLLLITAAMFVIIVVLWFILS